MSLYCDELLACANTVNPYTPINFPVRAIGSGYLISIIAKQTGGNLDGFTVDVYSSGTAAVPNIAVHGDAAAEAVNANGGAGHADIYRVIDRITVAGAASVAKSYQSAGQGFYNAHNTTNERRNSRLYVSIAPTTPAAAKTFDVRVITRTPSDET